MRLALGLAVLSITAFAAQIEAPLPRALTLTAGAQRVLTIPRLHRISVGNSYIADLRSDGKKTLAVVAMSAGETTLRIWQDGSSTPQEVKVTVTGAAAPAAKAPAATKDERPGEIAGDALDLKPGEARVLLVRDLTRVAIGNDSVVGVKTLGNDRLELTGRAVGKTTLLVWSLGEQKSVLLTVRNPLK